jgi:CheY-like chemotaxis protein
VDILLSDPHTRNFIVVPGLSAEDCANHGVRPEAPLPAVSDLDNPANVFRPRLPAAGPPVFDGTAKISRASRASRGKRPSRRQPRILVVDDVADVTEMIGLFLKHAGYEVATADSAQAALQLARSEKFDMVISDIGMPQMNGYELAGELRTLPNYGQIPIIAVTGYSEYDDRGRAVRAGFNSHLTKPVDPTGLLNLINELLG